MYATRVVSASQHAETKRAAGDQPCRAGSSYGSADIPSPLLGLPTDLIERIALSFLPAHPQRAVRFLSTSWNLRGRLREVNTRAQLQCRLYWRPELTHPEYSTSSKRLKQTPWWVSSTTPRRTERMRMLGISRDGSALTKLTSSDKPYGQRDSEPQLPHDHVTKGVGSLLPTRGVVSFKVELQSRGSVARSAWSVAVGVCYVQPNQRFAWALDLTRGVMISFGSSASDPLPDTVPKNKRRRLWNPPDQERAYDWRGMQIEVTVDRRDGSLRFGIFPGPARCGAMNYMDRDVHCTGMRYRVPDFNFPQNLPLRPFVSLNHVIDHVVFAPACVKATLPNP